MPNKAARRLCSRSPLCAPNAVLLGERLLQDVVEGDGHGQVAAHVQHLRGDRGGHGLVIAATHCAAQRALVVGTKSKVQH